MRKFQWWINHVKEEDMRAWVAKQRKKASRWFHFLADQMHYERPVQEQPKRPLTLFDYQRPTPNRDGWKFW